MSRTRNTRRSRSAGSRMSKEGVEEGDRRERILKKRRNSRRRARDLLSATHLDPVLLLLFSPAETTTADQKEGRPQLARSGGNRVWVARWRACVCVSAPGLQLQRSLFSRHQEGPGDRRAAGLLELDAEAHRRLNRQDVHGHSHSRVSPPFRPHRCALGRRTSDQSGAALARSTANGR